MPRVSGVFFAARLSAARCSFRPSCPRSTIVTSSPVGNDSSASVLPPQDRAGAGGVCQGFQTKEGRAVMTERQWRIHKFGGTSLANADSFRRVGEILRAQQDSHQAVVVSASAGVTDALLDLVGHAQRGSEDVDTLLGVLADRHKSYAAELLPASRRAVFEQVLEQDLRDLREILRAAALLKSSDRGIRDVVSGYGELWSAQLLAGHLAANEPAGDVRWLDARTVLTIDEHELGPVVNWEASQAALREQLPPDCAGTVVITGYIASDRDGVQTTLGRNGSDYSASIFGALLEAIDISIWTDVDGVMSADPRRVPDASVIHSLSYNEAMELAYFGAKVIHPQTMAPAVAKQVPIVIRNTFDSSKPGSRIAAVTDPDGQVKGITSIDGIALINLEGAGMIGVPGTADRLFHALHEAGISVVLISQASSEHSICVAVPEVAADRANAVVRRAFEVELRDGQIHDVEVTRSTSVLAVVGDGMAGTPGVAAKVFGALGESGVNIRAIAQGSSERNISAVIDSADATRALRAVHAGFYLSPQTISIGLIGPGNVGAALLSQIAGEQKRLREENNVDLRMRGILSRSNMLLDERALDLTAWREALGSSALAADIDEFANHVHADYLPHSVLIDCTASAETASRYEDWLHRGVHVITPNKRANSGPYDYYRRLRDARRNGRVHFLYETNVGAGLPVIQTVRDLVQTGDEVERIEGVFSGTMAYLFNRFDGKRPFSEIVLEARARGFTEPDPRDDLSGMDVARKLIILAREAGRRIELSDVRIESLVPAELAETDVDRFLAGLAEFDSRIMGLYESARRDGEVLRYVGRLGADGSATVGLERFSQSHPLASISLTDNVIQFATRRYCDNPLIVRGPGAGPDVTAAGVFADLLRLASYLGAAL